MRKRTGIFSVLLATLALWMASAASASASVAVSVSFFHDQLAPHGRWVVAGSYGNCWVPSGVAAGWEPYVDGQWVYSDYGWTWVSSDPWGDIPYHYGTWAYADPYGWVWVPGTVWAPAWVTWAYTDDYVGWAPVPPSFALGATGYFGSPVVVTATHYVFVPTRQFVGIPVATVRVPAPQAVAIVPRAVKTTRFDVSQGVVRVAGPPQRSVERAIGHPVQRVAVSSLRAQPTTLAAGGVAKAKSVRVVAPAKERERIVPEAGNAKVAPAAARSKVASTPAEKAKAEPRQAQARPVEKAPKAEKAQPKTKARPETETRQANVEHTQPAPKPKAKPKSEHPKANEPKAEPRHEEPGKPQAQAQREKPAKPKPETRPQPSEVRQANAEHAQPVPRPKPRPQAQHPQPKEKEKPQKDSGSSQN